MLMGKALEGENFKDEQYMIAILLTRTTGIGFDHHTVEKNI